MKKLKFTEGDSAMWLPDWLYKVLPLIYAVVGIGSGTLLVFAVYMIWNLRKDNREVCESR